AMSEIKKPLAGGSLRAHAARDFHRGFQTKNLVKGAAGGARGVDYQDHDAEYLERRAKSVEAQGGATAKAQEVGEQNAALKERMAQVQSATAQAERNPAEVVLTDLVQAPRDKVEVEDKPQDERRRPKLRPRQESEEPTDQPSAELAAPENELLVEPNSPAHEQHLLSSIAKVLQDPTAEHRVFGALVLQDPAQMRQSLGTPSRVAKHLLVLAGRLIERGQERPGVVEYLARTFLALGPEFGGRAFKDFSGSIGIGSIYPLEVREKIIEIDDRFLPTTKCRFTSGRRILQGRVKEMITIEYPEELRITSFAVKGGGRSGYQLAPLAEKGKYGLRLFQPGEYRLLLLGVDAMGFERMEELKVMVTAAEEPKPAAPAPQAGGLRRATRFNFSK
ncbi:MAG: hypothetical protein AB2A00_38180, partial [Myxococcota bacterium]